ncbi:Cullin-3 [Entomophthora muscae]|uniref:Cullin-3 n=1 Tax=Entomophthora muscae TaxID=34485 RepID=A0ACC2U570_9FUNG|nr:Cullin-3 [Entomophthora muscae]
MASRQPSGSAKTPQPPKVRLRPAKLASRQPPNHDDAFEQLRDAITEIYHQRQSLLRFEECYRNAYTIVRANLAPKLHEHVLATMGENLKELYQIHIQPFYAPICQQAVKSSPITILSSGPSSPSIMCDDVKPGAKNHS